MYIIYFGLKIAKNVDDLSVNLTGQEVVFLIFLEGKSF